MYASALRAALIKLDGAGFEGLGRLRRLADAMNAADWGEVKLSQALGFRYRQAPGYAAALEGADRRLEGLMHQRHGVRLGLRRLAAGFRRVAEGRGLSLDAALGVQRHPGRPAATVQSRADEFVGKVIDSLVVEDDRYENFRRAVDDCLLAKNHGQSPSDPYGLSKAESTGPDRRPGAFVAFVRLLDIAERADTSGAGRSPTERSLARPPEWLRNKMPRTPEAVEKAYDRYRGRQAGRRNQ